MGGVFFVYIILHITFQRKLSFSIWQHSPSPLVFRISSTPSNKHHNQQNQNINTMHGAKQPKTKQNRSHPPYPAYTILPPIVLFAIPLTASSTSPLTLLRPQHAELMLKATANERYEHFATTGVPLGRINTCRERMQTKAITPVTGSWLMK